MPKDPSTPDGGPTELSDAIAHALGNRRRIAMLQQLSEQELTAQELGHKHGLKGPATLHYLHQLRDHGWVEVSEVIQNRPGGVFEYRWRAVPGVYWAALAEHLNSLAEQLRPADDPPA